MHYCRDRVVRQFCKVADIFLKEKELDIFGALRHLASAEGASYPGIMEAFPPPPQEILKTEHFDE